MSADSSNQVLVMMQVLGYTDTPWIINSEIGDLRDVLLPPEPLFTFRRYDVQLEEDWLERELRLSLGKKGATIEQLRLLENASMIPLMYEIGKASAEEFVKTEHFTSMTDHDAESNLRASQ